MKILQLKDGPQTPFQDPLYILNKQHHEYEIENMEHSSAEGFDCNHYLGTQPRCRLV